MVNLQPYSGKFLREKMIFTEKIPVSSLLVPPKDAMPPNFVKKTFKNSQKTSKFTKDLSLESFPHTHKKTSLQDRQKLVGHTELTVALMTSTLNAPGWCRVFGRSRKHCTMSIRPCLSNESFLATK